MTLALGDIAPDFEAKTTEGQGYRLTPHVQRYYETTKA